MSSLPIPLLSLLRKFISEISVKRSHSSEAQTKPYGVLASLLRAAAIPSLGYLLGWNSRPGTASVGNEGASSSGEPAKKQKPSSMNLPPSRDGKEPKPTKVGNQQYDPTWPIYQLMNNPVLLDPVRRPRNPIVLSHGTFVSAPHTCAILNRSIRSVWLRRPRFHRMDQLANTLLVRCAGDSKKEGWCRSDRDESPFVRSFCCIQTVPDH